MHFLFLFTNFPTQVYKKSCEYVKSGYGTEKVGKNQTARSKFILMLIKFSYGTEKLANETTRS